MAGTRAGGLKAAATVRTKFGDNYYAEIGRKGGQNGHTGGFYADRALARAAGAKGGRISRRGPARNTKKIVRDGEEITRIFVHGAPSKTQKVSVNYGNN